MSDYLPEVIDGACGNVLEAGLEFGVLRILLDRHPATPPERLYRLYGRLERVTLRLIQRPEIWTRIDGLAATLIERGDLDASEATVATKNLGCWQSAMFPSLNRFAAEQAEAAERERERLSPERATLVLAAAGAAQVLGADHPSTIALARASETMDRTDLWRARLAIKRLWPDQRKAIARAVEN